MAVVDIKRQQPRHLLDGQYRLGPVRQVWLPPKSQFVQVWSAEDPLLLKAVAIGSSRQWHGVLSDRGFHLVGRGGTKAAVQKVSANLPEYQFVLCTDVKSYCAGIDWDTLMAP